MKLSKLALAPLAIAGLVATLHATELTIQDRGEGLPFVSQDSSGSIKDLTVIQELQPNREHCRMSFYVEKKLGTGFLTIGLLEPGATPADGFGVFVFIGWTQQASGITTFQVHFFSDLEPDLLTFTNAKLIVVERDHGRGNGFHPSDGLPKGFNLFIMSGAED